MDSSPNLPTAAALGTSGGAAVLAGRPDVSGTLTLSLEQNLLGFHSFLASTVHRDCQSGFSQGPPKMVLLQLPGRENQ